MAKPALRWMLPSLLLAGLVFGLQPAISRASSADEPWCGAVPTERDWVCPLGGSVFVKNHLLVNESTVPLTKRKLTTLPNSTARLTFREQAHCTLGESSEIFPRAGRRDSLFTQKRGSASCTSFVPGTVRILCGPVEPCPTELRANGEFLFKSYPPGGATSSSTETTRQLIQIVSCEGSIEVKLTSRGGLQRAGGEGSPGIRFVIVIRVVTKTIERSGFTSVEESATVKSEGTEAGPGECESSAFQEEEHTVTP